MAKSMVNPDTLDFSYNEVLPSSADFVSAVFHGALAVKNWLSCKFFFNSVKDHRKDDKWLKETYKSLMTEYKNKENYNFVPKSYRYTELKWKIEATYLMLNTPKNKRDKVDFDFVVDKRYENPPNILKSPTYMAGDTMYKIINKNAKKGVKNG